MKQKNLAIVLTAVLLLTPALAKAQVPSSADPGFVIRSLEEEERQPARLEETVTVPPETAGKGLSTEKAFTLKGVVLEGSSSYGAADLSPLYSDFIGQPVSFADLSTIAQRVTRKYREDGYVFSRAVLPPQKISDGVLRLQAVEGRIVNVDVVGNYEDENGLVKALADKIRQAGPANTKELERYLLLIDDLPGLTARSFVRPSATKGGGDLVISVEEDGFEGSGSIDNRGSEYLGQWRGTLVGAWNSLFDRHDRTTLRGILSSQMQELRFVDLTHEEQLGTEGTRLKGRIAMTKTEPGGEVSTQNIKGTSRLLELEALHPLVRGRQYNLNLYGGLTVLSSESEVFGIEVAHDKVRYVKAGTRFDFTDSLRGVNQFDMHLAQGLDIFGATDDGLGRSRGNGDHEFLRFNATATRIQDLWWRDLSLMLSAAGQYSPDALLASEEFAVGGPSFGRAYDSGEIVGDKGWSGAAELRYGGPLDTDFMRAYQVYTFIDYGKVWNREIVVGEVAEDSLSSAGLGVRFNLKENLSGYLELDQPLNKIVNGENGENSRLFFSLLKRF
jgi:hemolysin activation/secretion protein